MATTLNEMTRTRLQTAAAVVAVAFLGVGALGFVPGVTTNIDTMTFAGHEGEAKLFGLFEVSVLHNIVHLLFGVVGLAMARTALTARTFLVGGGLLYLGLWVYGLVIDKASSANFVPLNSADDWLHLVLGATMVFLGVTLARDRVVR